jgi:aldehyde dehydrogenase (NAD+)
MREALAFYIDGRWVAPQAGGAIPVENPATEAPLGDVALAIDADIDLAVAAARRAFAAGSAASREVRLERLSAILAAYDDCAEDLAVAVSEEMGAPLVVARSLHVPLGRSHLAIARELLTRFQFETWRGETLILKEPIGVCGLITPWNWPLNQITAKVAPAIATGCTMVLKPSEIAPFSAQVFAQIMNAAGLPGGVFNLVHGDGPGAGTLLSAHPDIDMISFTGSTRAGAEVARNAAPTVKRVTQELGGKGANILLDDDGFGAGVASGVEQLMRNAGQSCNAPARLLVPAHRMDEALAIAARVAEAVRVGDPRADVDMGPVASAAQRTKVQALIAKGIEEGASVVAGGLGRPEGLAKGYYVRPTVFGPVTNHMTIAREEIFGPVLSVLAYRSVEDAIAIANDTDYGLTNYVRGADLEQARAIARRLNSGQVVINGATDRTAPFGGYKRSGNGREWGDHGFHEFLETKAILGDCQSASSGRETRLEH